MNAHTPAPMGHNNPPDPIDEAMAPFGDLIEEIANWTDGEPVKDDAAMASVDRLIKEIKTARSTVEKARKAVTDPMQAAWKAEVARWKITTDDLACQQECLVALVAPYKAEKIRQQEEERREAARRAREAEEEARRAAREAQAGDLEAAREAAAKQAEFEAAEAARAKAAKEKVKGTRKVTRFEITDVSDVLRWMNKDAEGRADLEDAARVFVQRHHKTKAIAGVRVETYQEAF